MSEENKTEAPRLERSPFRGAHSITSEGYEAGEALGRVFDNFWEGVKGIKMDPRKRALMITHLQIAWGFATGGVADAHERPVTMADVHPGGGDIPRNPKLSAVPKQS